MKNIVCPIPCRKDGSISEEKIETSNKKSNCYSSTNDAFIDSS